MNIIISEIWATKIVIENNSLNTPLPWCWLLPPLDHFPSAKMVTEMAFWQNTLSYMRTECCSELSTYTTYNSTAMVLIPGQRTVPKNNPCARGRRSLVTIGPPQLCCIMLIQMYSQGYNPWDDSPSLATYAFSVPPLLNNATWIETLPLRFKFSCIYDALKHVHSYYGSADAQWLTYLS